LYSIREVEKIDKDDDDDDLIWRWFKYPRSILKKINKYGTEFLEWKLK